MAVAQRARRGRAPWAAPLLLSPPAEGRPAPSTGPPSAGPSWRGLGTPEETEVPHLQGTLGPTCDEELGGRCGTWGGGAANDC